MARAYIFLLDAVPRILPYVPGKDVGKVGRYSLVVKLSCELPRGEAADYPTGKLLSLKRAG